MGLEVGLRQSAQTIQLATMTSSRAGTWSRVTSWNARIQIRVSVWVGDMKMQGLRIP